MTNSSLPTDVTAGTPDLPGMLNTTHGEVNELSRSTGLRNITSLLMNGWTATTLLLIRERDWVHLMPRGLDGSAATNNVMLQFGTEAGQLPVGFRPINYSFEEMLRAADGSTTFIRADVNSILGQAGVNVGGYTRTVSWYCPVAWPATLPGTAV